jgi:hypothetical protein
MSDLRTTMADQSVGALEVESISVVRCLLVNEKSLEAEKKPV